MYSKLKNFLLTGNREENLNYFMQNFRLSNLHWKDRYKYSIWSVLIILLLIVVYFPVAFLGYLPDRVKYNSNLDISNEINSDTSWNPRLYAGTPWLWDHNLFENDLSAFFRTISGYLLDWRIIYLIIAALGVYTLLVFLGLKSNISFLTGIAFGFSPYLFRLLFQGNDSLFRSMALLPFIILFIQYLAKRKSILALGSLSFFLFLFFREMQLESIYILSLVLIIFLVKEFIRSVLEKKYQNLIVFIPLLILSLVLAIIPSLIHYLSLYDFSKLAATGFNEPNLFLVTKAVVPFLSIFITVLLLYYIIQKKKERKPSLNPIKYLFALFLVLSIIFFILGLSNLIPISEELYLITFCLTFILGSGYLYRKGFFSLTLFVILLSLVFLGFFILNFQGFYHRLSNRDLIKYNHKTSLTDDFLDNDKEMYRIYPLGDAFYENRWSHSNQTIGGSKYPVLKRYADILRCCLTAEIENRVPINWNILKMLNVKYVLYDNKLSLDNLDYSFYDLKKDITVYQNVEYLPRCWFVERTEEINNPKSIMRRLNDPNFDPEKVAIVEKEPGLINLPEESSVKLIQYEDEKIIYGVETDTLSYLILSEIYYEPGWKAYLDNLEIEIYPTNYILTGVIIPKGSHRLEFYFLQGRRKLANILGILGILLILTLIIIGTIIYRNVNYRGEIVYHLKT